MRVLKRLISFLLIGLVYLVIKEFLILYQAARSVHPYAAYAVMICMILFIAYFAVIPLFSILSMPRRHGPTRNPDEVIKMIKKRMGFFQSNKVYARKGFDFSRFSPDRAGYDEVLKVLQPEVRKLHKKYVTQVFYSTAIAQNGFLDAVLILVLSVNMVRDLFIIYQGRVSNRVLLSIGRMVFQSMLIGGSEGVEWAVDEIFSKMFSGGLKGVPFASKVLGSLADGFVNAALVTRIALITQNYCEKIFIESERALYPAHKTVTSTTRILISDLLERIAEETRSFAREKAGDVVLATVNPLGMIMSKAMNRAANEKENLTPEQREWMRETSGIAQNPYAFLYGWVRRLFKRDAD